MGVLEPISPHGQEGVPLPYGPKPGWHGVAVLRSPLFKPKRTKEVPLEEKRQGREELIPCSVPESYLLTKGIDCGAGSPLFLEDRLKAN